LQPAALPQDSPGLRGSNHIQQAGPDNKGAGGDYVFIQHQNRVYLKTHA
jgi:hypothetical protein